MMWMRMPGQTWPGSAASFVLMWTVMMAAMMLPSMAPVLWRYRRSIGSDGNALASWRTALVYVAYLSVWTLVGMVIFPAGAALMTASMQQPALTRAVPIAVGAVVLIAGAVQLTSWKARNLACCRSAFAHAAASSANKGSAWRHGMRLGLHCCSSCSGLTAILLAVGVMDIRAMALVTAAVTAERLAPAGVHAAQAIGAVAMGSGLILIVRAAATL